MITVIATAFYVDKTKKYLHTLQVLSVISTIVITALAIIMSLERGAPASNHYIVTLLSAILSMAN